MKALILILILTLVTCNFAGARESLSALGQSIAAQGDTDPFGNQDPELARVQVSDYSGDKPTKGNYYNLRLVPGGGGYPGMNIIFDKPANFSKYDVLKVWIKADYPATYLEIVINGTDGVIQDIALAPLASRGYGKIRAGQWQSAYVLYKDEPGWVRFGDKVDHTSIKSITLYTFAEYLKSFRPAYNYTIGGMELLTKEEARAEIASGSGRTAPASGRLLIKNKAFTVWSSDAADKVFKETPAPIALAKAVSVEGAGGEYVPVVCNIRPTQDTVITSITPRQFTSGKSIISTTNAVVRYLDNIQGPVEDYPDPLPLAKGKKITAPAGVNTTIWTFWRIPEGTKAGNYTGSIALNMSGGKKIDVPVTLKVYGFDLPKKSHLKSLYWIHHFYGGVPYFTERSKRYWGREIAAYSPDYIECTRNMIDNYGKHRITPELDRVEFQTFDRKQRIEFIKQYSFDPGFVLYHNYINEFLAMDPITPEKIAAVDSRIRAAADSVIADGYKDITCIKVSDEPSGEAVKMSALAAEEIQKTVPEIQSFYAGATSKIPDELVGKMDTYCMSWGLFDFLGSQAMQRRALGEKFWVYAADYRSNTAYDPLEMRLNYWLYWKLGITGVHYAHHMHECFFTYPNDTYMHSDGLHEIPSVRFEMLRLGLQDYEYLWMLKDLIDRTKTTDPAVVQLLEVPEKLAKNEWECSSNPSVIKERRSAIANAIVKLKSKLK